MIRLARTWIRRLRRRMYARRVAELSALQSRTFAEIRAARKNHRSTAHLWARQRQTAHEILRLEQ